MSLIAITKAVASNPFFCGWFSNDLIESSLKSLMLKYL
jgi:hypothetical protein